jgi:hypothetical protein
MIDILYNKLGSLNDDDSLAEWKDVAPEIFNRHSQHPLPLLPSEHPQPIKTETKQEPKQPIKTETKQEPKQPTLPPIPPKQTPHKQEPNNKKKTAKDTTIKPIDIIMNETTSFPNTAEHIKESIITLISKEEFSKIFGMTKCAEIMSGIVNNRWNKSTALFISFFLDKEVCYNEKVIVYNKEKNKGRITI